MSYKVSHTLPYRIELYRQLKRKRTLFAYLFVTALPVIVAAAVKFGPTGHAGGATKFGSGSADLIGLATKGAANFTFTMFYFATPFLLVAVISLFNGDTIASEASWSSLRYLLTAPIPRIRLAIQKLKVSLTLSLVAIIWLPVISWLVGFLAFGTTPFQSPLGISLSNSTSLQRITLTTAYLLFEFLFVAALAFWIGVRTDSPLGAVGVAVGIIILLNILDAINSLGNIRNFLPVHYFFSWFDALGAQISWGNMFRGAGYSIIWFVILLCAAIRKFQNKDIYS